MGFLWDKKATLTLYKCPESAQCVSAEEGKWHHGAAHHARSSWVMWSVDQSRCSDEQSSHRGRRRDERMAYLTTDTHSLWRRVHTHIQLMYLLLPHLLDAQTMHVLFHRQLAVLFTQLFAFSAISYICINIQIPIFKTTNSEGARGGNAA